jgi:hypothetical protein
VDLKLFAMQAGMFGRRFTLRFAPATFVVAVTVSAGVVGLSPAARGKPVTHLGARLRRPCGRRQGQQPHLPHRGPLRFLTAGDHGQWYLTRMVITCCAADARPVKVGLAGDLPGGLRPDGWVQITGLYITRTGNDAVNDETIPYLQVQSLDSIPAPARPYES